MPDQAGVYPLQAGSMFHTYRRRSESAPPAPVKFYKNLLFYTKLCSCGVSHWKKVKIPAFIPIQQGAIVEKRVNLIKRFSFYTPPRFLYKTVAFTAVRPMLPAQTSASTHLHCPTPSNSAPHPTSTNIHTICATPSAEFSAAAYLPTAFTSSLIFPTITDDIPIIRNLQPRQARPQAPKPSFSPSPTPQQPPSPPAHSKKLPH